jgi:hypothetical protein
MIIRFNLIFWKMTFWKRKCQNLIFSFFLGFSFPEKQAILFSVWWPILEKYIYLIILDTNIRIMKQNT